MDFRNRRRKRPVVQPFVQPWTSASETAHAIQHVDSHESRNDIQSDPWHTQTMRRNTREGSRKRDTISILGTGTADTLESMVAPTLTPLFGKQQNQ